MATILRQPTPAEAQALLAIERAERDFASAQARLDLARWNYHHIADERERARQRGHLRLLRSPATDRQRA
jgi:hypothetical protein